MASHEVLVIGIGGAGCSILSAVDRFVRAEKVDGRYSLVAIDSNSRSLRDAAPGTAARYHLSTSQKSFRTDCQSIQYLEADSELVPDAGTSRRRPLGRYLVGSNADASGLIDFFKEKLQDIDRRRGDSSEASLIVWIVNSLGGGTGSGAFPLVTLLLKQCCQSLDRPVEVYGVGVLPQLDDLDRRIQSPAGEPAHYANAYTALNELRTLMDIDGDTEFPFPVNIAASGERTQTTAIECTEPLFTGYWLLGIREAERLESGYIERMNDLAGRLIHYISSVDDREWFQQGCLYSVAGAALESPIEQLRDYHRTRQQLNRIETELESVLNRRDDFQSIEDSLREVLRITWDISPSAIDEERLAEIPVDTQHLSVCVRVASQFEPTQETSESLEELLTTYVGELTEWTDTTKEFPEDELFRYILLVLLLQRTREELAAHPLPEYLQQMENRWMSGNYDSTQPAVGEASSTDSDESYSEWCSRLLDILRSYRRELQNTVSESVMPAMFTVPGQRLAELEEDIERLESYAGEYERLRVIESTLVERRADVEEQLERRRGEFAEKIKARRDEWERLQQRWTHHSRRLDHLEAAITTTERDAGRVSLPLQGIETGDADTVTSLDETVTALLSADLLDHQELMDTVEVVLGMLDEPIEDQANARSSQIRGRLGILASETDHDTISDILMSDEFRAGESQQPFSRCLVDIHEIVDCSHVSTMYLLACYCPLSLEYTSEFGTIHDYYTDPEQNIESLLGSVSDSDLSRRFAYPDLATSVDQL